MANMFQDYFKSVFSDPNSPEIKQPDFTPAPIQCPSEELVYSIEDFEKAIDQIKPFSSCPDYDISALVIKKCKKTLSYPIKLIWDRSYTTAIIPKHFKTQITTPIHKKDSTAYVPNYRPITITSHIIKIFERILRDHLTHYLEVNNIISPMQHGFRKGRSCLTQLLAHYDDLLSNALDGKETDVIYLDFVKAFDKIDHKLLLKKLSLYGIKGKLYSWLKDFLVERVLYVNLNGKMSYDTVVVSGIPQGTVLGPILFLLFINDLASSVKHSTCRFFADDTRLSKAISSCEDNTLLQEDLNNVLKWSAENNMLLNETKFEFLSYNGATPNSLVKELPFRTQYLIRV